MRFLKWAGIAGHGTRTKQAVSFAVFVFYMCFFFFFLISFLDSADQT